MSHSGDAETVAALALSWLAEAELLDPFAAQTGADLAQVRALAADPAFLGAVLDFVLTRDDWVRDAAAAQGVPPERLALARAALPGGDLPHWT